MAPGEDIDSGMEDGSLRESESKGQESDADTELQEGNEGSSGSDSKPPQDVDAKASDDPYGDEPDETISERLWGLTEMFPESVRNATYTFATTTQTSMKSFYGFSRSAFWIVFSSSIVLFAPVIFEVERVQMEEAQRIQQKQMLLGPNTAVSGGNLPLVPSMQR